MSQKSQTKRMRRTKRTMTGANEPLASADIIDYPPGYSGVLFTGEYSRYWSQSSMDALIFSFLAGGVNTLLSVKSPEGCETWYVRIIIVPK